MSSHNQQYIDRVGKIIYGYCGAEDDQESDVKDVLADLMHFCLCTQMDFDKMLESARQSFEAEVREI